MNNIKEHVAAMPRAKALAYLEAQLNALEQLPDLKPDQVFSQVELQHLYVDRALELCAGPHLRSEDYLELCDIFTISTMLGILLAITGEAGVSALLWSIENGVIGLVDLLPKLKEQLIAEMQGVRCDQINRI
jgi:hypothetical protein